MKNLVIKAAFLAAAASAQLAAAQTRADGLTAMQLKDWEKAVRVYTELSKADPADLDAMLALSNAYLAKGDRGKALEVAQSASSVKSEDALALVAKAKALQLEGKAPEADRQFDRAAQKTKKNVVALRQIGECFMYYTPPGGKRPDLDRAVKLLQAAVEYNSDDLPSLMALGYAYKEQGNGGLAASLYEQAENLEPKNPLPKLMLARIYHAGNRFDKFLLYANKAIEAAPKFSPALRTKAEKLFLAHRWEEAMKAYEDLVNNGDEVTTEDEMQLANCYYINHRCQECSELVDKILKKDPSRNYLRRLKAYCDYDNGDYENGYAILQELFKNTPPEKLLASDYKYLGNLQIKTRRDTLEGIRNLKKSIAMDSSAWDTRLDIAKILYARRMNCEAVAEYAMYFDSAGTTGPKVAQDLYLMGLAQYFCTADSQNYEKAEKIFAKVAELVPSAGIGWFWAARSANKKDPTPEQIAADPELAKQYGKARAYYEQYVKVAGGDIAKNQKDLATAYQYLAYCYFVNNEADKFFPAVEKWLEVEPDPEARKSIMEMKDAFGK